MKEYPDIVTVKRYKTLESANALNWIWNQKVYDYTVCPCCGRKMYWTFDTKTPKESATIVTIKNRKRFNHLSFIAPICDECNKGFKNMTFKIDRKLLASYLHYKCPLFIHLWFRSRFLIVP